jgi:hypothetical protein
MKTNPNSRRMALAAALAGIAVLLPMRLPAHCDTMDGPVVIDGKAALEHKDVAPVLKWVRQRDEAGIKTAFAKTLAVRTKGSEARELADQYFLETLVRVHRAGEGAPFTGLKPAGTPLEPSIAETDKALESGSIEKVVKLVTEDAAAGVRKRFAAVKEKQQHASHNTEAGRAFVAAYVEYVHYVEGIDRAATGAGLHHDAESAAPGETAQNKPAAAEHLH